MRRRPVLFVAAILLVAFFYDAVLRSALAGLVSLPSIPGGLKVLTAILALFSVMHAWYALGGRPTLAFFALSAGVAWAYEQVGITTGLVFGAYHYTDYLGARLGDVPVLIPLAWFMMIYPSYVVANLLVDGRPTGTSGGVRRLLALAAASAVVMTAWDLVVDPILSGPSVRAWIWETGGPYFGIPIQNYAGWLLTTFTVYLAYRALERRWAGGLGAATARSGGGAGMPLSSAAAAMPVAAYGLMLVADLLSGVAPDGLILIGPLVMGVPLAAAAWRLRGSSVDRSAAAPVAAGAELAIDRSGAR